MRENNPSPKQPVQVPPSVAHRRQMNRQVWLPLILTGIVVLALMVLTVVGAVQGSSEVNRWGNISAVLIIIPVLVSSLLTLAILGAADYGLAKLLKNVPGWMLKAQLFMIQFSLAIRRAADATVKPIFTVNTFSTRTGTLWDKIFHPKSSR